MTGLTVPNSSAQVLVTLSSGTVVCPTETFKDFEATGPWRHRVDVIRSRDAGRSWGESAPAHTARYMADRGPAPPLVGGVPAPPGFRPQPPASQRAGFSDVIWRIVSSGTPSAARRGRNVSAR